MTSGSQIKESIRNIAGTNKRKMLFWLAKVVKIDGETCSVDINGLEISDVRLCAVNDDNVNNVVVKPKVGSMVMLADLSEGELRDLCVIGWSEVDTITISGGNNGGLTITPELVKQLGVLTNRVDAIIDAIKNAVPATDQSGAGLQTTIVAALNLITEKEDFSAIENSKIKH